MHFCYVDEAGCTGNLPSLTSNIQPLFVLCGLIVAESVAPELTKDFFSKSILGCRASSHKSHAP